MTVGELEGEARRGKREARCARYSLLCARSLNCAHPIHPGDLCSASGWGWPMGAWREEDCKEGGKSSQGVFLPVRSYYGYLNFPMKIITPTHSPVLTVLLFAGFQEWVSLLAYSLNSVSTPHHYQPWGPALSFLLLYVTLCFCCYLSCVVLFCCFEMRSYYVA